jgi:signal peptidase I
MSGPGEEAGETTAKPTAAQVPAGETPGAEIPAGEVQAGDVSSGVVFEVAASESPSRDKRPERSRALVEWAVIVVVALVAALLIKTFVVQAFFIPSQSMEPTLVPGDRVLVNKLSYDFHSVHDGDVIVFRRPPTDNSSVDDLIKRVIAGPGQWIRVTDCKVYVDGKLQKQAYLPKGWQLPTSEFCTQWDEPGMLQLANPYHVPPGDYFVMGDNRTDSDDSRYWGPLPAKYLVGRAFVRMWPLDRLGFL